MRCISLIVGIGEARRQGGESFERTLRIHVAKMIWTPETRLRNAFAKSIRRGGSINAELSPVAPEHIASLLSPGERCVVVIRDKKQRLLWATDRRVLREDGPSVRELFDFRDVGRVYRMAREKHWEVSKVDNYDRLEIDLTSGENRQFTPDELDHAYFPILMFLEWLCEQNRPSVQHVRHG